MLNKIPTAGGAMRYDQQRRGTVLVDPTKMTLNGSSPLRLNHENTSINKDGGSFISKMTKMKSSKSFKALHQENTEKQ